MSVVEVAKMLDFYESVDSRLCTDQGIAFTLGVDQDYIAWIEKGEHALTEEDLSRLERMPGTYQEVHARRAVCRGFAKSMSGVHA